MPAGQAPVEWIALGSQRPEDVNAGAWDLLLLIERRQTWIDPGVPDRQVIIGAHRREM